MTTYPKGMASLPRSRLCLAAERRPEALAAPVPAVLVLVEPSHVTVDTSREEGQQMDYQWIQDVDH